MFKCLNLVYIHYENINLYLICEEYSFSETITKTFGLPFLKLFSNTKNGYLHCESFGNQTKLMKFEVEFHCILNNSQKNRQNHTKWPKIDY